MKKTFLLFAALLTATVFNLQAADPDSIAKTSFASGDETGFALNNNIVAEVSSNYVMAQSGRLVFVQPGSLTIKAQNGCKIVGFSITYMGSGGATLGNQLVVPGRNYPLNNVESFTLNITRQINSPQRMATNASAALLLSSIKVFYIPDYLYFVGLNGNDTVRLNKWSNNTTNLANLTATFEYSTDRKTWTEYTWGGTDNKNGTAITLENAGDTVFFRAKGTNGKNATMSTGNTAYFTFAFGADDQIAAGGNTMSLYDATCEQDTMTEFGFIGLFGNNTQLVSAPKLPATKLKKVCYQYMFSGCTSLIQAPELKATTLAEYCYFAMFKNCSKLEVNTFSVSCDGAELEVPTVSGDAPTDWNKNMFKGCKGDAALTAQNGIQLGGHYCIKEYVPQTPVAYIDANGQEQSCTEYTVVEDATAQVTWNAGWYVVTGDVTLSAGAVCNGAVNLILADGAVLTATGTGANAGIQVSGTSNFLTIFGQSNLTGKLFAEGGSEYACGIGRPGTTDVQDGSIVVAGNWVVTVWTATTAGTVVTHSTTDNIASGLNGKQFVAIAKNVTPTAIQSIRGNNADQPVKFIQNGQLIIIRNGKIFNAQGAVVD